MHPLGRAQCPSAVCNRSAFSDKDTSDSLLCGREPAYLWRSMPVASEFLRLMCAIAQNARAQRLSMAAGARYSPP